jgi:hypothetical protein
MLERGGRRATGAFGALVYEPSNNISVHPGDTIYLYREPQTFFVFGAMAPTGESFLQTGGQTRRRSARPADWSNPWPISCTGAKAGT